MDLQGQIAFLREMGASEEMIAPLVEQLKGTKKEETPKPKPVENKKVIIKKKLVVKQKPVEEEKPKKVVIKRARGKPISGKKAEVLKGLGATDEDLGKKVVVEVKEEEPKPQLKRGRPKKIDVTKLSGNELMEQLDRFSVQEEQRDKMRAEAYQRKLEMRKEKRKALGKTKGRPKKEITEEPAPKPKPAPKPAKGLTEKDVKRLFQAYKTRTIGYKDGDLKETSKSIVNSLIELQTEVITNNSTINPNELVTTYSNAKKLYPDILTYQRFLDAIIFALYINSTITGERLTMTKDPRKARKDEREPQPEFAVYLQQDYDKKDYGFWVKFAYERLKTGKWLKSLQLLK